VGKALEAFRAFSHLFHALELEDLGKALEELESLEDGEARQSGEYVLVGRDDDFRALVRGGFFGDQALDEAFLLDHEVSFSPPSGDIDIGLRCHLHGYGPAGGTIGISGFVRYKNTQIDFVSESGVDVLAEDLGDVLLRKGLNTALAWHDPPPVLGAVLEAILDEEHPSLDEEHPSRALRDELFLRTLPLIVFGKLS